MMIEFSKGNKVVTHLNIVYIIHLFLVEYERKVQVKALLDHFNELKSWVSKQLIPATTTVVIDFNRLTFEEQKTLNLLLQKCAK